MIIPDHEVRLVYNKSPSVQYVPCPTEAANQLGAGAPHHGKQVSRHGRRRGKHVAGAAAPNILLSHLVRVGHGCQPRGRGQLELERRLEQRQITMSMHCVLFRMM
jgi:hypothetical protein